MSTACVQVLGYADYAFTSIFTVEILFKVASVTTHAGFAFCPAGSLPVFAPDDGSRSVPAPGFLLQELVQLAGSPRRQRLTRLFLPAVSTHSLLSNFMEVEFKIFAEKYTNWGRFPRLPKVAPKLPAAAS